MSRVKPSRSGLASARSNLRLPLGIRHDHVFLFDLGTGTPRPAHFGPSEVPMCIAQCSTELLRLLLERRVGGVQLGLPTSGTLLLGVSVGGDQSGRSVPSLDALSAEIKKLLAGAQDSGRSNPPKPWYGGVIERDSAAPSRQITATVVLLTPDEDARTYAKQMTGEGLGAVDEVVYKAARDRLAGRLDEARAQIALEFQPIIASKVRSIPQGTYEEKQELAKWLNAELRRLGLALRCPKTGEPSLLLADLGHDPEIGRFQFQHVDKEGIRSRPVSCVALPPIELTLAPLFRAPYRSRSR